ncbi:MAG: RluA family pseudouridine synthase [Peptostreptococcales bacterium]
MEKYEISIGKDEQNTRLDAILSAGLEDLSRNVIQKLIGEGFVMVNGDVEKSKKYKVKEKDCITIYIKEPERRALLPEDIPVSILYEDESIAVLNKPRGMVVHPAAGNFTHTLVNALLFKYKSLSTINGETRPGIVHRIDKDTSGILVIAKNDEAHQNLAEQFKEHTVYRIYHGIIYGNIKADSGVIDKPVGRNPSNRLKMAVTYEHSRNAVTHYQVLERYGDFTYIKFKLETGRTHQIRVHMAHEKHPLLGDRVYGPQKSKYNIEGQVLHAKSLGFKHPSTGEYVEFESELPEYFINAMEKIKRGRMK